MCSFRVATVNRIAMEILPNALSPSVPLARALMGDHLAQGWAKFLCKCFTVEAAHYMAKGVFTRLR
jgi:hypothetical protein